MRRLACVLVLCVGCSSSSTARVITLGALLDATGSDATPSWGGVVNLAVGDMNTALKQSSKYPRDVEFKFLIGDTANVPATAVARAKDLVLMQGAKGLITDTSQDDVAVIAENYDPSVPLGSLGVPIICFACTSPSINDPMASSTDPPTQAGLRNADHFSFRTAMASTLQATVLLKIMLARGTNGDVDGDGQFKISIFGSDEPFGRGFSAAIQAAASALHPSPPPVIEKLLHDPHVDANSYDWASDVMKLTDKFNETTMMMDGAPDVILDVDFPQYAAAMVKAYLNAGSTIPMLHAQTFRRVQVLVALENSANGQEGTSPVLVEDGDSGTVFTNELKAATGIAPDVWDANDYDAAVLLMLGAATAARALTDPSKVTPTQIRDALTKINDPNGQMVHTGPAEFAKALDVIAGGGTINYQGASGPVAFDSTGNVRENLSHWRLDNKKFVDLEKFNCVKSDACDLLGR